MIKITVDGSWATVGCSDAEARDFDRYFSVEIPHARFNRRWNQAIRAKKWDGMAHFFSRLSLRLPTGLVPLLIDKAGSPNVQLTYKELPTLKPEMRARFEKLSLNGITLSDFQLKAIDAALTSGRGILKIATNGGKTEVASGILKCLGLNTLYMVNRKELLHQTAERIELRTGIKVGKIGSGLREVKPVTVAMVQSLPPARKASKAFYDQWDVLIMDECQHGGASTFYKPAMFMRAPWKFALSGTPFTGDDLKDLRFISIFGPKILIEVRNEDLIERDWSARPTIYWWEVKSKPNGFSYQLAYDQMIVHNSKYQEGIVKLALEKADQGKSVLVLVNRLQQGLRMYRRLLSEKISVKFLNGSQGDDYRQQQLKRFKEGKTQIVIATPIFDEGVDVPAIQVLILTGGGKSQIALLQRVGRALRKKKQGPNTVEVHDFFHQGNRFLEDHSKERLSVYKREGFKVLEKGALESTPKSYSSKIDKDFDWHNFHLEENK